MGASTIVFLLLMLVAFAVMTTKSSGGSGNAGRFVALVVALSVPTVLASQLMGAPAQGGSVGGEVFLLGGGAAFVLTAALTWPYLLRRVVTVPRQVADEVRSLGLQRVDEDWGSVHRVRVPVRYVGEYQGWPVGYESGPGVAIAVDREGRAGSLWSNKDGVLWAGEGLQGPILAVLPRDFPIMDLVGVDLPQTEVPVGDEAFRNRFVVWCNGEDWARKVVDGELQQQLMQAAIPPAVLFRNGRVYNMVTHDAVLADSSAPLHVVLQVAKRIADASA